MRCNILNAADDAQDRTGWGGAAESETKEKWMPHRSGRFDEVGQTVSSRMRRRRERCSSLTGRDEAERGEWRTVLLLLLQCRNSCNSLLSEPSSIVMPCRTLLHNIAITEAEASSSRWGWDLTTARRWEGRRWRVLEIESGQQQERRTASQ